MLFAVVRCLSVRPSVTLSYYVWTAKHVVEIVSPPGSRTSVHANWRKPVQIYLVKTRQTTRTTPTFIKTIWHLRATLWCIRVDEILHTNVAHWISPNDLRIAYMSFNDSHVPLYKFQVHGPPSNLYSNTNEVPYPKVNCFSVWFHMCKYLICLSILPPVQKSVMFFNHKAFSSPVVSICCCCSRCFLQCQCQSCCPLSNIIHPLPRFLRPGSGHWKRFVQT